MIVETSPASTTPARKSAGSRNRSDRNMLVLLVPRFPRGSYLVADSPHGHDRRGVAELAAQLPHVDVDGAGVAGERIAPDALEQLVAREHESAVVEQLPEEVELLRGELDLLVADTHLATTGVDREVAA